MKQYVVCMDSSYIRDAQMFDPAGLSENEMNDVDIHSEAVECYWHDMEPTPFIGIAQAYDAEEAIHKTAEQYRYDARCLFAIEIG